MSPESWIFAGVAVLLAAAITGFIRRAALLRGLLDVPNARSSHSVPTPRGGGLSIVVVTILGVAWLAWRGQIDRELFWAVAGGGAAVATIGFVDDRRSVPAWLRLLVHLSAAVWAVQWLGGLPPVRIGGTLYGLSGLAGNVLAILGIVWALNLFNFMDGIDGIAAGEAIFMCWSAVVLAVLSGGGLGASCVALLLGAAALGFLFWNWPRAGIFMGDVGSGFLGFVIAVTALASARTNPVAIFIWLILGAAFFADSGVTLVRRLLRGARVYEAHRCHAYQHLALRWGSHLPVTASVIAFNVAWLLPCALLAQTYPTSAWLFVLAGLVPPVLVALAVGAGRED